MSNVSKVVMGGLALVLTSVGCASDGPTEPGMQPVAAAAGFTYNVVQLGALGGTDGEASDMLDGRIVGYAETGAGRFLAFLWENGAMRDLGALPNSVLPGSRATALNSSVQVVGYSQANAIGGGTADHAFLWQNETMLDLGTLGGKASRALAINTAGTVVGHAQRADGAERAVRWRNGVIQDLGTLGGSQAAALGINDAGVIVGRSEVKTGNYRPFVWRNGAMRSLPTLKGGFAQANAINSAGVIVGESNLTPAIQHAVMWKDGKIIDLGTLKGDRVSIAMDIDDSGRITGFSMESNSINARTRVFLWEKGQMRNLGTSAGQPNRALGIAAAGHLVGSSTVNGEQVATLWRRIP
jgi:probable HAF family extracellular repeat protein